MTDNLIPKAMRGILLCLILAMSGVVDAQIVTIPDVALKTHLLGATAANARAKDINGDSMVVDVNADGEIQVNEALNVYQIRANNEDIADATGIQGFENLTKLEIEGNDLTTIDVSGMTNLEILMVENNHLTSLNLSGCAGLKELWCWFNELTVLDLAGLPSLERLVCSNNQLTTLDLSPVNLSSLSCGNNLFTALDLTSQTGLTNLAMWENLNLVSVNLMNGVVDPVDTETFNGCVNLDYICADEDEITTVVEAIEAMSWSPLDVTVDSDCALPQEDIVNIPDPMFKAILVSGAGFNAEGVLVDIDTNDDGEIQVTEAENIVELYNIFTETTTLEGIEAFVNLTKLEFNFQGITTIDFNLPVLKELYIVNSSDIEVLDCTGFPLLEILEVASTDNLSSFIFDGLEHLELVTFTTTNVPAVLDFTTVPSLKELHLIGVTGLTDLNLTDMPNLETVSATSEELNNISFGYLPNLTSLTAGGGQITTGDLSGCPALSYFSFGGQALKHVNIKNGQTEYEYFGLTTDFDPYICIDEGEEEYLQFLIDEYDAVVNTYCSYFPGGDYNTITGTATYDAEGNGCGEGDAANAFLKIAIDNGAESQFAYTNMAGEFMFFTQQGNYTVTPQFENDWFTITPGSASVEWTSVDNAVSDQDFCITANGVHNDAEITLAPIVPARPGFDALYGITFKNNGNQVLSGSVTFDFDDSVVDYIDASIPESSIAAGSFYTTLTWEYEDLQPFESRVIVVTMNVNGPMETPAVNNGDHLPYVSNIEFDGIDETPSNNHSSLKQVVVGSFDPNDITCIDGSSLTPEWIGEYLHYNINFENTGDFPAEFIVVKQQVDLEMFDINTLELLYASHNVLANVEGNIIEYRFDNIDLGPLEKGNIVFKIKTLNSLQTGDEVMQQAEIYFDYNWPIITNEAITTFEEIVNIPDPALKASIVSADEENNIARDSEGNSMTVDTNGDGEIQVTEALAVYELHMGGTAIADATGVQSFENLTVLSITKSNLVTLDVSGMENLEVLEVGVNQLTDLSLTGCTSLIELDCMVNQLQSLDLTGLTSLSNLTALQNQISAIDLSAVNLTVLWLAQNPIVELDLSTQTNLDFLIMDSCTELASVNLKNGVIDPVNGDSFLNCTSLMQMCADEEEVDSIYDEIEGVPGLSDDIWISTYCTAFPGGNFNTITGVLNFDGEENGCDESDAFNSFTKIIVNDGVQDGIAYTNLGGQYNFFIQSGTFSITPVLENDWFTVTPETATATFESDGETAIHNFCVVPNGVHPDLEVLLVPVIPAQPGFDAVYNVVYKNKGNQVLSGDLVLSYNDDVTDFVSAAPAQASSTPGILSWEFEGLQPFENRSVEVVFNVNSPMETPAVNKGDILNFTITGEQEADETPADNEFLLAQEIRGSFDPNDITCIEGDIVDSDYIGEYLHYIINFENTGTVAAAFIVIKQTINEAQFDVSTLEILNASHDVATKVEGNIVEYRFDDIDLGPLERGNIVFKIKTLTSLQVGDDVMQKAEIYFDYNWPIITNEAVTVFEELAGIGEFEPDNTVKIYPNPVQDKLNITAGHTINSIELYDLQGRLLQTVLTNGTEAGIDLGGRAAGVYFVKVTTERGVKVEKVINE